MRFPAFTSRLLGVAFCLVSLLSLGKASAADEPRPLFVEGYAGRVSYSPSEELTLHVSTTAATLAVEIVRLGSKTESVWSTASVAGREYPIPENASSHGCLWPAAVSVKIPADWRSGYYRVALRARDGGGGYTHRNARTAEGSCYFVLRAAEPGKSSKILLQLSTHTYNAYNNWGGSSLYAYNSRNNNQGHRVSFERPPASQFESWERPFVEWAERSGYTLEYAANGDLKSQPNCSRRTDSCSASDTMNIGPAPCGTLFEKFIQDGGNVAFFSGNTCCWQVRSEDGGRALTCWKQNYFSDPVYAARQGFGTLSSLWSHHLVNRPENQLTGVGFLRGGYHKSHGQLMDGSGAFTVHRPDHWIFAGTNLKRDDTFGGKDTVVGYECDGCELTWKDGLPTPTCRDGTPESFSVLCTAPAQWHPDDCQWYEKWENGRKGNAVLGVYTRGGTVFTCGSTDWSHGLRGGDPSVDRITRNILERLSK